MPNALSSVSSSRRVYGTPKLMLITLGPAVIAVFSAAITFDDRQAADVDRAEHGLRVDADDADTVLRRGRDRRDGGPVEVLE